AAATARLTVVLERDRRRDAVAELRRVGDAVDAESAGITRNAVVRVAVRRERVDVEVRPDAARREAGELDEAAIDPQRVGSRSVRPRGARTAGRPLRADVHVRPQGAVFGLRAQIDADAGADAEAEGSGIGPSLTAGGIAVAGACRLIAARRIVRRLRTN